MLTADQPNLCDGLSLAERRMVIEWRENTGQFAADGGGLVPENPRVLSVPAGTLRLRATYRFEALVYMQQDPAINATSKCSVYVQPQPLVAGLDGGVERIVGAAARRTLDASPSYDPDVRSRARTRRRVRVVVRQRERDARDAVRRRERRAAAAGARRVRRGERDGHARGGHARGGRRLRVLARVSKDTRARAATVRIIIIPGAPPETTAGLGGLDARRGRQPERRRQPGVPRARRLGGRRRADRDVGVDARGRRRHGRELAVRRRGDRLTTALALRR